MARQAPLAGRFAAGTDRRGPPHAWLGYGVAAVIVFRLLWAIGGERQVDLMRFYPDFDGLKLKCALTHPAISRVFMLGIALSLLTVTGTGIAMDQGRALGLRPTVIERAANPANETAPRTERQGIEDAEDEDDEGRKDGEGGPLGEIHELAANLPLKFVGMHVAYPILFKRPLAKFTLFFPRAGKTKPEAALPT